MITRKIKVLTRSTAFRIIVIMLGLVQTLFLSGIGFGWASMSLFLEKNEVYSGLCPNPGELCDDQAAAIQLLFTIGVFCFSMVSFPAGYVLDRFGAFITCAVGTLFIFFGFLFYGLAPSNPNSYYFADDFLIGTGFIMGGGMAIFMASFRLSTLFPQRTGLILGLVNAFFDASALLPFIILFLERYLTRKEVFLGYAVIPAFYFFISPLWGNTKTYKNPQEYSDLSSRETIEDSIVNVEVEMTNEKYLAKFLSTKTLFGQLRTWIYFFIVFFFSFNNVSLNFYMGSVAWQIYSIESDPELADRFIYIFSIILPFGALFGPVIGWFIDNKGLIISMWIVITCGAFGFFCSLIPNIYAQIPTFVLLSAYRPMMYSIVTVYISDLFGFSNFGKLYGINTFLNGFLNLLQYPILIAVFDYLDGNFFYLNFAIVISLTVCYIIPIYLYLKAKSLRRADSSSLHSALIVDHNSLSS